jgi:hypothetical protein
LTSSEVAARAFFGQNIRRDAETGDVVLSKPIASWDEYFDWVRALEGARSAGGRHARSAAEAQAAEFRLDTEVASRLMRAERRAATNLGRPGGKSVSISSITMTELLGIPERNPVSEDADLKPISLYGS